MDATHSTRLNIDLRAHKAAIALPFTLIFICSCLIPIALYFGLTYSHVNLSQVAILAIPGAIFGVSSLSSFIPRTIRLYRNVDARPLGSTSAWQFDYFNWNFLLGLVYITVMISVSLSRKPADVRLLSIPLALLLCQVCGQFVIVAVLRACSIRTPFRISSLARGDALRPGCAVIAEDICAVDGKQGQDFRSRWGAKYAADITFREFLSTMDLMWGISGLVVAAGILAIVFAVPNVSVGYAVGWIVPWVWAAAMTLTTISMAKKLPCNDAQPSKEIGV